MARERREVPEIELIKTAKPEPIWSSGMLSEIPGL